MIEKLLRTAYRSKFASTSVHRFHATLALGFAPLIVVGDATGLHYSPMPKARDESPDMPTIFPIGVTKSSLQLRFLNERNVNEIEDHEADCPDTMVQRQQGERLTEQAHNDSGNHGIPDELNTVHARRIHVAGPRGRASFPIGRKAPYRSSEEDKSQAEQTEADQLEEDGTDRATEG